MLMARWHWVRSADGFAKFGLNARGSRPAARFRAVRTPRTPKTDPDTNPDTKNREFTDIFAKLLQVSGCPGCPAEKEGRGVVLVHPGVAAASTF